MSFCNKISRRKWLVDSSLAAGAWISAARPVHSQPPRSANDAIRFACVGVEGMGKNNRTAAAKYGDVVALCDVDEQNLDKAAADHPNAVRSFDFRKMFEGHGKRFDAVVISTPDHAHTAIALMALRAGKHVYCEKGLCRYLYEARLLGQVARTSNLATQMGNQGTARNQMRRAIERIREGVIGQIREVHIWTNRPVWPCGADLVPKLGEKPPTTLHWDEFVGPAQMTPFSPDYHPFKWRAWWRFGNGALGDMGAHSMNAAFHACDLTNPVSIEAQHSGHNGISYPKSAFVRWEFAATPKRGPITLNWYDGGRKPDASLFGSVPIASGGCLLVGADGVLVNVGEYAEYNAKWQRIPGNGAEALDGPTELLPINNASDHFGEFVQAIRGNGACLSNFADVGVPFTETVLLGNLAILKGTKIQWDSKNFRAEGIAPDDPAIRPTYRAGYDL